MHRNLKLLALFHFFTDLDFFAPVAIIYFAQVSGSHALGMSIFSFMMIFSALFEVPTGIFSDMIGRKKTLTLGATASLLSALSIAVGTHYWFLFSAAVFAGLARAFYSGNNEALIYETLQESGQETSYHHFLGKLSSVFQLALILSAFSGSLIASWSFRSLVWVAVFPKLIMVIISLFFVEPKTKSRKTTNVFSHLKESVRIFRSNTKLRFLAMATAVQFAVGESAYTFRAAFVRTVWPLWAVGISNVASHICAAFSYFLGGKVIDKIGEKRVLIFEIWFNRAVNLTALLFPGPVSPLLMGVSSVTYGAGDIARKHLSQKEFGAGERATMASLISVSQSVLFAAVSFGLGALADATNVVSALLAAHVALLIPLVFYKRIFRVEPT